MRLKLWTVAMVTAAAAMAAGALAAGSLAAVATEIAPALAAVVGTVSYSGTPDGGRKPQLAADPYCVSAHPEPPVIRTIVTDAGGGLANVFVWVKNPPPAPSPASGDALVDQVGCLYLPHAIGVRSGQTVVFRNSDPTLHNINVQPRVNPAFNVGQPFAGMETRRSFAKAETGILVRCDVHPWMVGYISVFEHPYFAVSGADGSFRIEGLPDGSYVIETWHESLGAQTQQVTVAGGLASLQVGYTG